MTKLDIQPLMRFIEHLPPSGDPELALLKCHLLIEEVLTKLITSQLKNPEHLSKARLSFSQKTHLARSLSSLDANLWVWVAALKLNKARNELAHGLSSSDIQGRLNEFVEFVEKEQGAPKPEVLSGAFGRFQWGAFKLFSRLAAYAHLNLDSLMIRPAFPAVRSRDAEQAVEADGRS